MSKVLSSLACNLDGHILTAALPLLAADRVQAIEWSFDALFKLKEVPTWFTDLLHEYAAAGRLLGHGVFFSLFSGRWSNEQEDWLRQLKKLSAEYRFAHITEHFGFMTGEHFHAGAPISIPFTRSTLALGRDRLQRIYEACQCPVGLENLAFAYSLDEVRSHGHFLEQLIEPINGFIILDLHNLYCQLHNFEMPFADLIRLYPLERVREIHISGGSWEESALLPGKAIRRDTHDDAVPKEVFDLLQQALPLCPNLQFVVLEQIGTGLHTPAHREQYQRDFLQMQTLVQQHNERSAVIPVNDFLPPTLAPLSAPLEDATLHTQQQELSQILEGAADYEAAVAQLQSSTLAHSAWQIEDWAPHMVETVLKIAQKWK